MELELRRLWSELESQRRLAREERDALEEWMNQELWQTRGMVGRNAGQISALLRDQDGQ